MTTYNIIRHYVGIDLIGIWVEQDIGPPASAYKGAGVDALEDARATVLDKPDGMTWHDHLDHVGEGEPWTKHRYALGSFDAVSSPDAKITLSLMQAEDERLRSR